MSIWHGRTRPSFVLFVLIVISTCATAQSRSYTTLTGTVTDSSGAVVPGATIEIHNPVSQFERTATSDAAGNFSIQNIPFNPYHMTVKATGFNTHVQDLDVRSAVPMSLKIALTLGAASETVTTAR